MLEKHNTTALVTRAERIVEVPSRLPEEMDGGETRFDPILILRRALRGRYAWMAGLTVFAAIVGAIVGWFVEKPLYKSEGLIRIAYTLPPIISETDQNAALPMFDSYMRSQALRMSSRSLVEKALMNINGGQPISPEALADVADNLTVEHPADDEHLRVTYVDNDPRDAAAVVQAMVFAFRDEYDRTEKQSEDERLAVLAGYQGDLQTKLDDDQNKAANLSVKDSFQQMSVNQHTMLVSDQLAVAEQILHGYLLQQQQLEDNLAQAREEYFEDHPKVQELKFSLERTKRLVAKYQGVVESLRGIVPDPIASPLPGSDGTPAANDGPPPTQMPSQIDAAKATEQKLELDRIESDATALRTKLAEATERAEALKLESAESRLEIISTGDVPLQPFRDRRRILAWMGATFGGCLPIAMLVVINVVRPRFRYSDETEVDIAGPAGLLGILPALPERLRDPESAAGAAQCVHQMRVMLQVASGGGPRHYLLTSAVAGEGKTSLTMALGLSFSASGSRTLVVDCDMVGRALTRGLGASDELGLFEALGSGDALRYIKKTKAGVWFLPAGRVNALYASKVSHVSIRRFLENMRKEFDVVLIDSGPILGSIEAAILAPEVDGVIVAVTRGQQSNLVEKTSQHLRAMGAKIEGYVFNRAKTKDFHHSTYGSSTRPTSSRDVLVRIVSDDVDGLLRFGPLVESVMSSLPEQEQDAA